MGDHCGNEFGRHHNFFRLSKYYTPVVSLKNRAMDAERIWELCMGILPTMWIDKIIYFVSIELCYLWCFDTCGSLIGEFKPLNLVNIFPKQKADNM